MTSTTKNEQFVYRRSTNDVAIIEANLRKDKVKTKLNYARSRNSLLLKVKYMQSSSYYIKVLDACKNMDILMENTIEILSKMIQFYIENNELEEKGNMVIEEMENIEKDFYATYEIVLSYLDSRAIDSSSDSSARRSINDERQNEEDENTEISHEKQLPITSNRTLDNVVNFDTTDHLEQTQNRENTEKPIESTSTLTQTDFAGQNIGHDMWTQLKRIRIPVFSGDKRMYPNWKAAFMACIDKAPVTSEYKMLQLRQYVSGEALTTIESLGHSSSSYEAAKDRLERKYGGKRRQRAIFLDAIEQFQQVRPGYAEDLEQFADLLELMIINLTESGEDRDLGDGSFYIQLQRKLPQSLLARYHRWLFENNITESVEALKTWVNEESRFQIIASETVSGLTKQTSGVQANESKPYSTEHETFFINTRTCQPESSCQVCTGQHRIWNCQVFGQKSASERWDIAKRFKLCFRCLAEGHEGKACRKTRRCGKDGCHKVHHRLLHVETGTCRIGVSELKSDTEPKLKLNSEPEAISACYLTFGMEGKKFTKQSYYYGGPIKDENMNACFNSGVTDNEGTRAAMSSNTINSRTLSLNEHNSSRSDHVQ